MSFNNKGATLIEMMAAAAILALVVLSFSTLSDYLHAAYSQDTNRANVLRLAEEKLTELRQSIPTTPPNIPEVGSQNAEFAQDHFRITVRETPFGPTEAGQYDPLPEGQHRVSLQGGFILYNPATDDYEPRLITVTVTWGER